MSRTVILHFVNDDPVISEADELPKPTDATITVTSPRKVDGKPLTYVTAGAVSFIFPMHRISFIEVMSSEEERREVIDFFRE